MLAGMVLTLWLIGNLVQGVLRDEFISIQQWGPPFGAVVASLLMFLIARSRSLSSEWILRAGLVYQVVISFCIVFGSSYHADIGAATSDITSDRSGSRGYFPGSSFSRSWCRRPSARPSSC